MTENLPAKYERQLESFALPQELDNLDGLLQFEGEVISSARTAKESVDRFGFHLHLILKNKMWRHHLDGKSKQVFGNQKEYLEYLAGKTRAGISTMKSYNKALLMGKWIGRDNVKAVSEVGLPTLVKMSTFVKMDEETGEPKGLKHGTPPGNMPIKEYLSKVATDFAEGEFVPGEYDKEKAMHKALAPGKPRVEFDIPDRRNPLYVIWIAEAYDSEGMLIEYPGNYGPVKSDSPGFVLFEWYKRVGVTWKEEYQ